MFKKLEDMKINDQFLQICPVDVRDHDPKITEQAAEIADPYTANQMHKEQDHTRQSVLVKK